METQANTPKLETT